MLEVDGTGATVPVATGVPREATMSAKIAADEPTMLNGTAACCSGGGIRSASYCLGALEALAADPAEQELKTVTAVSGGSYIAMAGALAEAPERPAAGSGAAVSADSGDGSGGAAYLRRFQPGSEMETRLRDHTHYLLPDAVRGLRGMLSLLWGAVGNMLLVGSLIFVVSALDGWLLSAIGGMSWNQQGPSSPMTLAQIWIPAGLGAAALLAYAFSRVAEKPPSDVRPLAAERWQTWSAVLFGLATAATVLLVAAPALFTALWNAGGNGPPSADTTAWTGVGAFPVIAAGAAALAKVAAGTISASWRRVGPVQGTVRPWLVRAGHVLTPWLGSAFVVLSLAAAGVYVIGTSSAPGYPRWAIAIAAGAFAVLHMGLDVNRSSMHDFYRDRLASAYADRTMARVRMSELKAGTDLRICAAANLRGEAPDGRSGSPMPGVPPGRGAVSCVFTPDVTELHFPGRHGRVEGALTRSYEDLIRPDRLTVFDVVAISGAAVAPLMGKMTSAADRILFGAVNLRLGVWLPRPSLVGLFDGRTRDDRPAGHAAWSASKDVPDALRGPLTGWRLAAWDRIRYHHQSQDRHSWLRPRCAVNNLLWRLWQPNLQLLWREVAGSNPENAAWIYLSDGGHYDNLGLVEALRTHPARVHIVDASGDARRTYATLGQAIALARSELGVEISIEPADMEHSPAVGLDGQSPDGHKPAKISGRPTDIVRPFATGSYLFTEGSCQGQAGQIDIVKLGVWAGHDLPWDVRAYFACHRTFPRDSTLKQLYDDEDFEAYRELGQASMQALLAHRRIRPAEIWIAV